METHKKIRVLHIVQSPGGVERYIKMLLKYMDHNKYENILIGSYEYKNKNYIGLVDGFTNVDMVRSISFTKDFKAILKVRKLIKKYNPDLLYLHSSKAGAIGRIANIGLHKRCIYNPHGWAFNIRGNKIAQFIFIIIEKILAFFCDAIICISKAEEESALSKKICSKEKIRVIYNGIDISEYKADFGKLSRKDLGITDTAYVVGMVGRLSKQKAPEIFVKAAKLIKKQIPEAFFLMVGDGADKDKIKHLISESGLEDSFYISGWVSHPLAYIQLFDVAVLLSRWEGFGLVLPEYMLANKPIIATRVDAIPEIITDKVNGLLVTVDDYEDVAKNVMLIYKDKQLRESLTSKNKHTVFEKFNIERVAREHELLFKELAK